MKKSKWLKAINLNENARFSSAKTATKVGFQNFKNRFHVGGDKYIGWPELKVNETKLFYRHLEMIAFWKDENKLIHCISGRCNFDYAPLKWNSVKFSWDCLDCGSRFSPKGIVLHGPATKNLEKINRFQQSTAKIKRHKPE